DAPPPDTINPPDETVSVLLTPNVPVILVLPVILAPPDEIVTSPLLVIPVVVISPLAFTWNWLVAPTENNPSGVKSPPTPTFPPSGLSTSVRPPWDAPLKSYAPISNRLVVSLVGTDLK